MPWRGLSRSQVLFAAAILFWFALIAVFVWLRLPLPSDRMINVDEKIPVAISAAMTASGHLDPNWALADVPQMFRYDQYNFYLYNVLGHFAQQAGALVGMEPLDALRIMNIVCQAGALLLLLLGLRWARAGWAWFVGTALMLCVAPTVVHDALMARPESLLYLLTAAGFCVALAPLTLTARAVGIGLICGLGASVKLTFPIVALSALLALLVLRRVSVVELARLALVFSVGGAAGFALGAPLALVNWEVTLNGFSALFEQYNRHHAPYSLIEPTFLGQLMWTLRVFTELYWPCFLLIGLGLLVGTREERIAIAVLAAPFLVLVIYFSTKVVFFERNLSHALPLLLVATGAGAAAAVRRLPTQILALLVFCVASLPGLYWSTQIAHAARFDPEERATFEERNGLTTFSLINRGLNLNFRAPPPLCGRIIVQSFRDQWTARYESNVRAAGYREVARRTGAFSSLSQSTLQIFIAPDRAYFEKSCGAQLQLTSASVVGNWMASGHHDSVGMPSIENDLWGSHHPAGDVGVGVNRLTFAVPRNTTVLTMPVVSGPDPTGQRVRVLGPGDTVIAEIPLTIGFQAWRLVQVPAPAGGFPDEIIVEGVDEGVAWGQWVGFGAPRALGSSGDGDG